MKKSISIFVASLIVIFFVMICIVAAPNMIFADNFAAGEKMDLSTEMSAITNDASIKVVIGTPLLLAKKAMEICNLPGVLVGKSCKTGIIVLQSGEDAIVYAEYAVEIGKDDDVMCVHVFGFDGINISTSNCNDPGGSQGVCSCFWREIIETEKTVKFTTDTD